MSHPCAARLEADVPQGRELVVLARRPGPRVARAREGPVGPEGEGAPLDEVERLEAADDARVAWATKR